MPTSSALCWRSRLLAFRGGGGGGGGGRGGGGRGNGEGEEKKAEEKEYVHVHEILAESLFCFAFGFENCTYLVLLSLSKPNSIKLRQLTKFHGIPWQGI
jgi:hypothetical protein